MTEKPLPNLLLWKLRAHHAQAELALAKAREAVRRRDDLVSQAQKELLAEIPEGQALLEIDTDTGVFRFGPVADLASASIDSSSSREEGSNGTD